MDTVLIVLVPCEQSLHVPKKQETGIRQGCPLSPYLFVMVMTVIMHDVHSDLEKGSLQKGFHDEYSFIDFWELLYADDTLIIGKTDEKS